MYSLTADELWDGGNGPRGFFARHSYFTTDEFTRAYVADGHSASSVEDCLAYHARTGRIFRVRRGLYASNGTGHDFFELAMKLAPNPVLAYRGALAFHGLIGVDYHLVVAADRRVRHDVFFNDVFYTVVQHPLPPGCEQFQTVEDSSRGIPVRVTTPARTLVDCMDRLHLSPGFVETFELFASHPTLEINFDEVVEYVRTLGKPIVAARVGVCLWGHPRWNALSYRQQFTLARLAGKETRYALPARPNGKYCCISRFHLIVPDGFSSAMTRARSATRI